ncbi:DUF2089 domain-containing protein [Virgibacillus soli]|uniref:DUF2089 domain-containing protein n=1 Tax=Paracerasibacillus soli TaxID=480284 RepID=UPI0035ED8A29
MTHQVLTHCPICSNTLTITKLHCQHCHTTIENDFKFSRISQLSEDQLHFVEVFLVSRGNIKEVEKELGVSYPTVRGKLNDIISTLGYKKEEKKNHTAISKENIVTMLENEEITPDEAIKLLKR